MWDADAEVFLHSSVLWPWVQLAFRVHGCWVDLQAMCYHGYGAWSGCLVAPGWYHVSTPNANKNSQDIGSVKVL